MATHPSRPTLFLWLTPALLPSLQAYSSVPCAQPSVGTSAILHSAILSSYLQVFNQVYTPTTPAWHGFSTSSSDLQTLSPSPAFSFTCCPHPNVSIIFKFIVFILLISSGHAETARGQEIPWILFPVKSLKHMARYFQDKVRYSWAPCGMLLQTLGAALGIQGDLNEEPASWAMAIIFGVVSDHVG